jgi:hypothetical protein
LKPLKSAGNFKPVPEGPHPAILYSLIDMGTQPGTYQGKPSNPKRKIAMRFELHGEDTKLDDGRPMSIGKTFTLSSSPKGNLRPFMEGWRGKAFTDEDFEAFDLQNMLQKPAIVTVVEDGEYRVINGISRLIAGMTPPVMVNSPIYLSLEPGEFDEGVFNSLSDKMKEAIRQSPEYQGLNGKAIDAAVAAAAGGAPFDDEIPF